MTRFGEPIRKYHVKGVNPQISYNMSYAIWEAAIAAGATLEEMEKIESGAYSNMFVAKLVAWHRLHGTIDNNVEDAKIKAMKKGKK